MITQKEMVSAIYNCVKKREKHFIDEKAFLKCGNSRASPTGPQTAV